jgi:hypothetical protein
MQYRQTVGLKTVSVLTVGVLTSRLKTAKHYGLLNNDILMRDEMMMSIDQHFELDVYSVSSPEQQYTCIHVAPMLDQWDNPVLDIYVILYRNCTSQNHQCFERPSWSLSYVYKQNIGWFMFNATFNNISVISWWSVLLVEETEGPRENQCPVASHWQTLSYNFVHLALVEIRTFYTSILLFKSKNCLKISDYKRTFCQGCLLFIYMSIYYTNSYNFGVVVAVIIW